MRILALSVLLLSNTAAAAETIDQQQAWQPGTPITIEVPRGDLTLSGTDANTVQVSGTLDEQTKQFVFEQQSDQLLIKVELPKNWGNNQDNNLQRSDLTITLPTEAAVSVEVVSTDIKAVSLNSVAIDAVSSDIELRQGNGRFDINSVSGEIDTEALSGELIIKTVSGDIAAQNSDGKLLLSSVSGDIEIEQVSGKIDLESVSGDIELQIDQINALQGRVVSGDIDINGGTLTSDGKVSLESVSGDISLAITPLEQVQLSAQTGGGGSIDNRWSSTRPTKNKYGGGSRLQFGQSGPKVQISTVSGDIELQKR